MFQIVANYDTDLFSSRRMTSKGKFQSFVPRTGNHRVCLQKINRYSRISKEKLSKSQGSGSFPSRRIPPATGGHT